MVDFRIEQSDNVVPFSRRTTLFAEAVRHVVQGKNNSRPYAHLEKKVIVEKPKRFHTRVPYVTFKTYDRALLFNTGVATFGLFAGAFVLVFVIRTVEFALIK